MTHPNIQSRPSPVDVVRSILLSLGRRRWVPSSTKMNHRLISRGRGARLGKMALVAFACSIGCDRTLKTPGPPHATDGPASTSAAISMDAATAHGPVAGHPRLWVRAEDLP